MMDKFTQFANPDGKHKLTIDETAEEPLHRLPFIRAPKQGTAISYWNVPDAGGYFGGHQTAKQLSQLYLRHLLHHGTGGGTLQHIAFQMFGIGFCDNKENSPNLSDAQRGQVVGFFCELERWLITAISVRRAELNNLDVEAVLRAAEGGLNFDEPAWFASMGRSDKSNARAKNKSTTATKKKVGAK